MLNYMKMEIVVHKSIEKEFKEPKEFKELSVQLREMQISQWASGRLTYLSISMKIIMACVTVLLN